MVFFGNTMYLLLCQLGVMESVWGECFRKGRDDGREAESTVYEESRIRRENMYNALRNVWDEDPSFIYLPQYSTI